jgi:hypothetical protein
VRGALGQVREEVWQGCARLQTCQVPEGLIQLTGWKTACGVIFARKLLGVIRRPEHAGFWDSHQHEFAVSVTNLQTFCNAWQIQELYRQRADTENVFDGPKNRWSFSGFAAKSRATTKLAARLLLPVYNLWVLFVRFIVPQKHTEAKRGRRWFLLIAGRLVESGRQKELQVSIMGGWADPLRTGYTRITECLRKTAPQLEYQMTARDPDLDTVAPSPP